MDESGSPSETSLADARGVFDDVGGPRTPLTTNEVAAELDCERGVAAEKLATLAEKGALKRKETESGDRIWWRPATQQTAVDAERADEYRALVQAVEDYAIFMLDPDGYIRTWNEGAERIKGYREADILGEHLSVFYPDDADVDPDHLLDRAAAAGSIEDEGWRVREDGEKFWARVTVTALYDEDDELRGFAKITRDLSDRHRREEALRREHDITEQFRLLVENVKEYAIFMLDPDGYVQSWNAGAEQVKGYAEAEIVGEHFSTFYPEAAVEAGVPEENLEKARARGHFEDEGWRVRKDGSRFWANVTITPIHDDDGELRGFAKVTRDMTERHEYEEQLRQEKERFQRMVESVRDYAIFMLDPGGNIQTWNEGAERIKGYREAEVLGEHFSLFYPEDRTGATPDELLAQAAAQGRVGDEGWRVRKDGSRFWASVVITALYDDDGELRGFVKVTRDLTERKRREDRLAALDEMGRRLLETETPREVSETVIDAAEADLALPITAIALYDDESGSLQPLGQTTRAAELRVDVPFLNPASDIPWEAFGDDEPLVVDALSHRPDREAAEQPVTSGVIVPIGRHGVFITGFETTDGPSDEEIDFVKIVAADLEAALNHVERQQLLREREATLEEQNESLARINRVNGIIRTIDQALIGASTRAEVEQAVCTELATAAPYRVAWIGRRESASETVTPTAWAGVDATYADELDVTAADGPSESHPAGIATRSREPCAIQDIRSDPPFEPWRKEALKRGYRSMISVPIRYGDSLYGVLTVQAEQPDTFSGMEAQVIEELGETVAHAINALESKRALVSDEIVELEFRATDPEIPILQLTDDADCAFELDNVLSHEDGSISAFFTTRGAAPAEIGEFVDQSLVVSDLRLITENEAECVFEATLSEGSFVATLLDHGAIPRTITAEDGDGRVVVSLPPQVDVREFVEMLQSKYGDLELTARRTRERKARTPDEFNAAFEDRITDRQREVLQTAYFSGFFDTPRKSTGEEIGDALGVSQPTVNHHLRACQRELLGMLYDEP